MTHAPTRCLILACGNTLRSDDGVGHWLAAWAEDRYRDDPAVRVIARQQWTPDLAEEVARAGSVLFIDCSTQSAPGAIALTPVEPAQNTQALATHHLGVAELLALAKELYDSLPRVAQLLTIGAASTELGEAFSAPVEAALPRARAMLEDAVMHFHGD